MKEFPNKNWKRWTLDELRQRVVSVWKDLEQHVIDSAIDQWRRRLRACVRAKGGHFEHSLWINIAEN